MTKTFLAINFGCRVNAAETNQWSQTFIEQGFIPSTIHDLPSIIFVNTCAITKKGEIESISKIRILQKKFPDAKIIVTGCANFSKLKNIFSIDNKNKEKILKKLNSFYTKKIKDKFSSSRRFILKIQSGCTQNCSYCIVPKKRPYLFSLPISDAIKTIKKIENDYDEIIITGVNLIQYQYGFSNLIENILEKTNIKLISFGSIPLNCIDEKFIELLNNPRISHFLHIPIQSGSDRILKLMHRPYNRAKIIETFTSLRESRNSGRRSNPDGIATSASWRTRDDTIDFGTDIIVGFPTETETDFQDTLTLCQQIGFKKIHTFKYSPRPETEAQKLFEKNKKIGKEELKRRSTLIRNLSAKP
jgi:threonylcarbamoyladenosine tRNA methylthiotransferase MtaB